MYGPFDASLTVLLYSNSVLIRLRAAAAPRNFTKFSLDWAPLLALSFNPHTTDLCFVCGCSLVCLCSPQLDSDRDTQNTPLTTG